MERGPCLTSAMKTGDVYLRNSVYYKRREDAPTDEDIIGLVGEEGVIETYLRTIAACAR